MDTVLVPSPFRLLDLPAEIRELIYERCLVSTRMINLTSLVHGSLHITRERMGLTPQILSTCRQIRKEATMTLYGLNTFYMDHLIAWSLMKSEGHRALGPTLRRVCAECSYFSLWDDYGVMARRDDYGSVERRNDDVRNFHITWNPQIRLIRRLHVSLRPYSFSQWDDVRTAVELLDEGCRPVDDCAHMLLDHLPQDLRLDLMVCYISKPGLLDRGEVLFPARLNLLLGKYVVSGSQWIEQVANEMAAETKSILQFAQRISKVVVLPSSDSTWPINLDILQSRSEFDYRRQCFHTAIPPWLRRSGNLSTLEKAEPSDSNVQSNQWRLVRDKLALVSGRLSQDGVIPVSIWGPDFDPCFITLIIILH